MDEMETSQLNGRTLVQRAEEYVQGIFSQKIGQIFAYHNFDHTRRVLESGRMIGEKAGLTSEELEMIELSALFHDAGFSRSKDDHESHSKDIAREFLIGEEYPEEKLAKVLACIDSTRMAHEPTDRLEQIMKDADMNSLGGEDYFDQAEKLRTELNNVHNEGLDENAWGLINIQFLKDHSFYTPEAQELFGEKKKANIKMLEKKLGLRKKKKKRAKKEPAGPSTIATSKSAQTQFKTSLRNHIDLSAIADNKANIMLSVNALIVTIALPMLIPMIRTDPIMGIPTALLLIVCVVSIIYATLATRPIKMKGYSSSDDITKKKANLFFFGNFYRMSFDEYEEGIGLVVANDDLLDNAITRDLFFLGKALGKKYNYLRLCYTIFMYGIILAVLAFVVVALFFGGNVISMQ